MKKIIVALIALTALSVYSCAATPSSSPVKPGSTTTYNVTVTITPTAGDNAIGLWGSLTTNVSGQFIYDTGWNNANPLIPVLYVSNTNANGQLVFTINNVNPSTNAITIQARGSAAGDWTDTPYWSFPDYTADTYLSNVTMSWVRSSATFSQNSVLNITLDISAVTNALDLNGNGTYGEVGDAWIGGVPAAIFGGYSDTLAGSTTTNTNTGAIGTSPNFVIAIPAGTTTTIDTSIFGVADNTGNTWDMYTKFAASFNALDQATDNITLTAVNADGGFGKCKTTVSGDYSAQTVNFVAK
jgi:hypothetical protein